jgi:hypothetical protein
MESIWICPYNTGAREGNVREMGGEEKVTWLKRKHLRNPRKRGEEAGLVT